MNYRPYFRESTWSSVYKGTSHQDWCVDTTGWQYLAVRSIDWEDCCVSVNKVNTNSTLRWMKPVRETMKIEEERTGELLQFETDADLVCHCGIMDETITVNVRARAPNTKEGIEDIQLKENNGVNIVEGANEREDPFQ
eukprot:scaffold303960_cov67-Attheya_sp.AAC.3